MAKVSSRKFRHGHWSLANPDGYIFSRFRLRAMVTASAREEAPSFSQTAVMCCFTALTDIPRSAAICSEVCPFETPTSTSR